LDDNEIIEESEMLNQLGGKVPLIRPHNVPEA
jgi:hypothetical protein